MPDYMPATRFFVPALLQASKLWLFGKQRWPLPMEHLEVQGFNIYGSGDATFQDVDDSTQLLAEKFKCQFVDRLAAMGATKIKSVAGNGMNLQVVGAVLAFALRCQRECS